MNTLPPTDPVPPRGPNRIPHYVALTIAVLVLVGVAIAVL